jgi:hypothetical protein
MARLTKKDLKNLFKECLREILLEEGLIASSNNRPIVSENKKLDRNLLRDKIRQQVSDDNEDIVSSINNQGLLENIKHIASDVGAGSKNANLYAQILADTAMTTLQDQNIPGETGGVRLEGLNVYTKEQAIKDSESLQTLSSGDLGQWAKIAFSKK